MFSLFVYLSSFCIYSSSSSSFLRIDKKNLNNEMDTIVYLGGYRRDTNQKIETKAI